MVIVTHTTCKSKFTPDSTVELGRGSQRAGRKHTNKLKTFEGFVWIHRQIHNFDVRKTKNEPQYTTEKDHFFKMNLLLSLSVVFINTTTKSQAAQIETVDEPPINAPGRLMPCCKL